MEIGKHPIWGKVSSLKKPAHFLRFFLARKIAGLYPRSSFIGITGSVGKTTTKEACLAVLSQKYPTLATYENIDPIFNIPSTLLKLRPKIKKVILEMGIEYPGEMDFYLSLVKPATAIVTRLSFAHSEFLGSLEEIIKEKSTLVRQLPKNGFAILNWDDLHTRKLAGETEAQVIFYGTNSKHCHLWASNIQLGQGFTSFELNYGVERVQVDLKLLGEHFVLAALAAAALGLTCDMSLTAIKKGLEKMETPSHRLQLVEGMDGWSVLDDTYNSSPAALNEALHVLSELPARRRIAILGEMKELGIYSERLHRMIAQEIYKQKIDLLLLGTGETKFISDELLKLGFPAERMEVNLSNSQMVSKVLHILGKGDLILVKGSRAVKLDEVVARISKEKRR
ncbi:MAG: UDP-N-acetylmuramoyl-tripeptide--D-alanyl-D-alanine ligase [bacterium]|nr:UDP-N-acetylmuramoyl-tripeptide--D-alanyl-D-alanine ligase [bacterium]